jgi:hypothetical protein
MDLEQLQTLKPSDRWVFLRGRIASEAVDMDAALRGLHAILRNRHDREALLEAPESWGATWRECIEKLTTHDVDDELRRAIRSALDHAARAWNSRNRYMHDLLVARVDPIDEPSVVERQTRAEDDRYRLRLAPRSEATEVESVSISDAISLVCSITAAKWRLRAARLYLANESTSWRSMLLGHVTGDWDGNADWISSDSDD